MNIWLDQSVARNTLTLLFYRPRMSLDMVARFGGKGYDQDGEIRM